LKLYPIDSILPELTDAIIRNPAVVLHAPPGAGKTTRVPLRLLNLIPPEKGRIIMLEPRRIAAVSAARWMAKTIGEEAGQTVGFSIRFENRISEKTRLEVVTEGILTRRIQSDPGLEGVAMVIFDEFHERSLQADLALALILDIRKGLREDLKVLVMSATLDCGPIAYFLRGAPVITSGGRAFPVEERYLMEKKEGTLQERTCNAVAAALKETSGGILVFLPGAGEIRTCSEALRPVVELRAQDITIYPLYGDLAFEEQERAILPSKKRKIVLATNIAETSLTIEGIQAVVDSGLTRRLRYDPSSGMNRLMTVPVSKASSEQRKGRAGRLGPGFCYRLYSRQTFQAMVPFTPPEILTSDLSSLVLELAVWGVKDPSELCWLDAPPVAAWDSALRLLKDLGAVGPAGSVTSLGRQMARLPLHPRLSRLLLKAVELDCRTLGADLSALLSERDILRRGTASGIDYAKEADISERMDILRKWRKGNEAPDGADPWALRTVDKTSKQLMRLTSGKEGFENKESHDLIPRLLLCGFPDRVAKLREEGEGRFLLCQGRGVRLSPKSRLIKSPFIIAVNVDAGDKADGFVHLAAPLDEETIREECGGRVETLRRVEWGRRDARIIATIEERFGSLLLSSHPFNPSNGEALPLVCELVRSSPSGRLNFTREARQFQARVSLMRRTFPEEDWPDLSDQRLNSRPEDWILPWLGNIRTLEGLSALDLLPGLRGLLSWKEQRRLDEMAPESITVPSGSSVKIDYTSGDVPVLAVKLQEMFGLADTPEISDGRVKLLLHLLSPARRPVQITQDLKGFWNSGYQLVKKELKGRYPKHPWPEDPWNAVPTRKAKPRGN
jgi:ATP-dependent helicase HrpB